MLSCRERVISINSQNTTDAISSATPIINLKYNNSQDVHTRNPGLQHEKKIKYTEL